MGGGRVFVKTRLFPLATVEILVMVEYDAMLKNERRQNVEMNILIVEGNRAVLKTTANP